MTPQQVKDLMYSLWTRVGNDRVDDADLRAVGEAIIDLVAALEQDLFPDWAAGLEFMTDGTLDGKYSKHPDTNGKKRIFETKTDNNIGNEPPTDPLITENANWLEISQSAKSALVEWEAGLYGAGLIVVLWNHSVDGLGLYLLAEPTRPFASTDIEAEITAGQWIRFTGTELVTVDTTGANITMDLNNSQGRIFKGSDVIDGARTWILANDGKARKIKFHFEIDADHKQTMPANVKMSDPLWERTTPDTWEPYDAGQYEAQLDYDGVNYKLKIFGPFT